MTMPFEKGFRVSSAYGWRTDPIDGSRSFHGGVDLVGRDNAVRAVRAGAVLKSRIVTDPNDRTSEWGNYIAVYGEDSKIYYYCHLESRGVEVGERVEEGQVIGLEGATGRVTGKHLHFEIRESNNYTTVNPAEIIGIPNEAGYVWVPEPDYVKQASPWAKDAVAWAVEKGILKGRGEGDWALRDPITREEMCVMLYRAREVL